MEDSEIFVCRANHDGDTIPGSYIVDENLEGKCYISYNFSVIRKTQFEVHIYFTILYLAMNLKKIGI